jgi:hypothetical protein
MMANPGNDICMILGITTPSPEGGEKVFIKKVWFPDGN